MTAIQSPVVTLSYPHLWKPVPKAEGSTELVFSAVGLLNEQQMKSPAWKALYAACEKASLSAFPKLIFGKSVKSPFRDCAEKENFPQEYKIFFNCWSATKPGVVDTGRNHITDFERGLGRSICPLLPQSVFLGAQRQEGRQPGAQSCADYQVGRIEAPRRSQAGRGKLRRRIRRRDG